MSLRVNGNNDDYQVQGANYELKTPNKTGETKSTQTKSSITRTDENSYQVASFDDDYFDDKITEIYDNAPDYTPDAKYTSEELTALEAERDEISDNISAKQIDLRSAYDGSHPEIAELKGAYDDAVNEYNEALNTSENPQIIAIKEEIQTVNDNISLTEMAIAFYETEIPLTEGKIAEQDGIIASLDSEIGAYDAEISSLTSQIASIEDEDKKATLQSRLSSLKSLKGNAEARKKSEESVKEVLEEKLETLNKENDEAKDELESFIIARDDLELEVRDTEDEIITAALDKMQDAREAFENAKSELIEKINSEIQTLNEELSAKDAEITAYKEKLFEEQMKEENSLPADEIPTTVTPASYSGGGGGVGGVGGSGGAGGLGTSGTKASELVNTENLQDSYDTAKDELEADQKSRLNIFKGQDADLSSLKDVSDSDFDSFITALEGVDSSLAKEITNKKNALDNKESEIDALDLKIAEYEDNLNALKSELSGIEITLEALNAVKKELDNVNKSELTGDKLTQYNEKKQGIEAEIKALQDRKDEIETKIADDSEYQANVSKRSTLKGEYDTLYNELTSAMSQATSKYSDVTNNFKTSYDAYKDAKASKIEELNGKITQGEAKTDELYKTYKVSESVDVAKKYKFSSADGEDILNFAMSFIGCNEADGSADKFLGGGYSSSTTPWCAAFVSYVMQNFGDYDNIQDWYKDIGNKWYCPNIYNSAKNAGAIIDKSEARPGDIVLFDWDGDGTKDHIGIVVSIDADGTVHTIEGNTSNQVAKRDYSAGDGRLIFCKAFN